MTKAYIGVTDAEFNKWVHDMMSTRAWDPSKLKKLGIKIRSRYVGVNMFM